MEEMKIERVEGRERGGDQYLPPKLRVPDEADEERKLWSKINNRAERAEVAEDKSCVEEGGRNGEKGGQGYRKDEFLGLRERKHTHGPLSRRSNPYPSP